MASRQIVTFLLLYTTASESHKVRENRLSAETVPTLSLALLPEYLEAGF